MSPSNSLCLLDQNPRLWFCCRRHYSFCHHCSFHPPSSSHSRPSSSHSRPISALHSSSLRSTCAHIASTDLFVHLCSCLRLPDPCFISSFAFESYCSRSDRPAAAALYSYQTISLDWRLPILKRVNLCSDPWSTAPLHSQPTTHRFGFVRSPFVKLAVMKRIFSFCEERRKVLYLLNLSVLFSFRSVHPDFLFSLILTCFSLVRSVPFWWRNAPAQFRPRFHPDLILLCFSFALSFCPRSSCFVLPRFCYRSLYEDLCFYPRSSSFRSSWVCFSLEVLCVFVLRVFYSILDILFLFLVLSKLKFVISTLSLREGINIIRLFLGDIILEILFDIISLSVFLYGYI